MSVVVPVRNEAENVGPLMVELAESLDSLTRTWELIWVDDASTDGTTAVLRSLVNSFAEVRILELERHGGQSSALWAGLQAAYGNTFVTLDGDGQNDPMNIPHLLDELASADMVVGYRRQRYDPLPKRLFSAIANSARNLLTGSRIPDSGCGLRVFRRDVLACFVPFDGMHRFLPTMAEIAGFRVRSIEVNHRRRLRGWSKYGVLDRVIGPLMDCLMLRRLMSRQLPDVNYCEFKPSTNTAPIRSYSRASADALCDD